MIDGVFEFDEDQRGGGGGSFHIFWKLIKNKGGAEKDEEKN